MSDESDVQAAADWAFTRRMKDRAAVVRGADIIRRGWRDVGLARGWSDPNPMPRFHLFTRHHKDTQ